MWRFRDGLARQLDQVEGSIENVPQILPGFDAASDGNEPNIQSEGAKDFDTPMSPDGLGAVETGEVQGHGRFDGSGWPDT